MMKNHQANFNKGIATKYLAIIYGFENEVCASAPDTVNLTTWLCPRAEKWESQEMTLGRTIRGYSQRDSPSMLRILSFPLVMKSNERLSRKKGS